MTIEAAGVVNVKRGSEEGSTHGLPTVTMAPGGTINGREIVALPPATRAAAKEGSCSQEYAFEEGDERDEHSSSVKMAQAATMVHALQAAGTAEDAEAAAASLGELGREDGGRQVLIEAGVMRALCEALAKLPEVSSTLVLFMVDILRLVSRETDGVAAEDFDTILQITATHMEEAEVVSTLCMACHNIATGSPAGVAMLQGAGAAEVILCGLHEHHDDATSCASALAVLVALECTQRSSGDEARAGQVDATSLCKAAVEVLGSHSSAPTALLQALRAIAVIGVRCDHAFPLWQQAHDGVVDAIQSHGSDSKLANAGLAALGVVTRHVLTSHTSTATVTALRTVLMEEEASARSWGAVAEGLVILARSPSEENDGMAEVVVKALKMGQDVPEVVTAALFTFGYVVRCEKARDAAKECGAVEVVAAVMAQYRKEAQIQGFGLAVLMEMASGGALDVTTCGCAAAAAASALEVHVEHAGVASDAVFTLYLMLPLIKNEASPTQQASLRQALQCALEVHGGDETLQSRAQEVLETLD